MESVVKDIEYFGRNPLNNKRMFDCREWIKPGDVIEFDSMMCSEFGKSTGKCQSVKARGRVTKVYEQFIRVSLRYVEETVNRWDISKVNGHPVANGCFKNLGE